MISMASAALAGEVDVNDPVEPTAGPDEVPTAAPS
jgi:hypothetical protein